MFPPIRSTSLAVANTGSRISLCECGVPEYLAVDPKGKFAYVANAGGYQGVSAYTINATSGALTPVAGSPFAAGWPRGVAVDPKGKFAYVTNYYSDNVSAYTINASSGALTQLAGSPFAAGTNPDGIAVDAKGKFVYLVTNARTMFRLIRSRPAAAR